MASQPSSFVPRGWLLEDAVTADLNGDQRPDKVLALQQGKSVDYLSGGPRALVVLLSQADGSWRRVAYALHVLMEPTDFGPRTGRPHLSVVQGVLRIQQDGGSRYYVSRTQLFRIVLQTGRCRFIGEERKVVDSNGNGLSASYSTNLLTGKQIVVTDAGGETYKPRTRKLQLHLKPIYIEEVNNGATNSHGLPWLPKSYDSYQ
ncbi:hypothetical protein [Hymenobacter properus]|uniref:VCBS repeat-containing protein n=1 Tax=Hymenobacter properus TaxID=2791026 RepID=A0A931FGN3_9BACT|nr:hypothetical protein [Hymenobacter properus]MBF9140142.1 hypothetical protein [Hymenobacter properus]